MVFSGQQSRWVWVGAFVLLLATTSGAVVVLQGVDGSSESTSLAANVSEVRQSLSGMTGFRRTGIERGGVTETTVERVKRLPGSGKYWVAEAGSGNGTDLEVSNGSVLWLYDAADQSAHRIELGASRSERTERIDRLLSILNRTEGDDATYRGAVSPLPIVPTEGDQAASTAGVAGSLTVSYEGTETIAERTTHVIRLQSNADTSAFVSDFTQTIWLDQQWYVPLQRVTEYQRNDTDVSITVGYENVTLDRALPSGTFRFDPPENATVHVSERPVVHYVDRAGLRAASSFSLPDPSLPDSFTLVDATRTVDRGVRSIGLRYENPTSQVTVSKSNLTWFRPSTEGRTVAIGQRNATLRNLGTELRLSWTCDDARYSVAGTGLSSQTLIEVARSIACE